MKEDRCPFCGCLASGHYKDSEENYVMIYWCGIKIIRSGFCIEKEKENKGIKNETQNLQHPKDISKG